MENVISVKQLMQKEDFNSINIWDMEIRIIKFYIMQLINMASIILLLK